MIKKYKVVCFSFYRFHVLLVFYFIFFNSQFCFLLWFYKIIIFLFILNCWIFFIGNYYNLGSCVYFFFCKEEFGQIYHRKRKRE